jgi:hypothetical protein
MTRHPTEERKLTETGGETNPFCGESTELLETPDISIATVRDQIEADFPEYWMAVDAGLATCATLLLQDNADPTALIYIGGPACGKSTVVNMFEGYNRAYRSDDFTPAAFIGAKSDATSRDLEKNDLLPKIRHKVLLTDELASTFRGRADRLVEKFNVLTKVLSGTGYTRDTATQGRRGKTGDYMFAWLAGTTPFPETTWQMMSQLGSRLFFFTMALPSERSAEEMLHEDVEDPYRVRRDRCRQAVSRFLNDLCGKDEDVRSIPWGIDPESVRLWLNRCAQLVAASRSLPQEGLIESPTRAKSVLTNLARDHALVHGRRTVTEDDLPLITHVAVSSMPTILASVFRTVLTTKPPKIGAITQVLGRELEPGRQLIHKLKVLRIVQVKGHMVEPTKEFAWVKSLEFLRLLGISGQHVPTSIPV